MSDCMKRTSDAIVLCADHGRHCAAGQQGCWWHRQGHCDRPEGSGKHASFLPKCLLGLWNSICAGGLLHVCMLRYLSQGPEGSFCYTC